MTTTKKNSEKTQNEELNSLTLDQIKSAGRFRLQFDFAYGGTKGQEHTKDSKTVPDMSLTVRQLLENHTRGNNDPSIIKTPVYFDIEVPTIRDITDVEAFKEQLEHQLAKTKDFLVQEYDQLEQRKQEEEIQKAKEFAKSNPSEKPASTEPSPEPK